MWTPDIHWYDLIIRAIVVYAFLLTLLRITGKRQVGQLAPFDLVLLLVLSNAVQNSMNGGDNSLTGGLVSATTLVALNFLMSWATYRSNVTPDEVALYESGEYTEFLPTSRIKMLLERPKSYGTINLQRVKHSRFTQPLLNVILLLLAVPCVVSREPGKIKQGIFQCVILCGACLSAIFLCYQVAGTPPAGAQWLDRWPATSRSSR